MILNVKETKQQSSSLELNWNENHEHSLEFYFKGK